MNCRHCNTTALHPFLDLGSSPPSNAYLTPNTISEGEKYFPLRVLVCTQCWLVQTEDFAKADDLFNNDYAYFSSVSSSWLKHASQYCEMITSLIKLNANSLVVEVAANDGYLLKNFLNAGIPCIGIEPTASTAAAAEKQGITIIREFFGTQLAKRIASTTQADLIIGNNVLAHVPDINDFASGLKLLLKPRGVITLEFPHLLRLIEGLQFDTIYHEHFSYLSLHVVVAVLSKVGLRVWDVEEITTHGGSLRVYGCHAEDARETHRHVSDVLHAEKSNGLLDISVYDAFQNQADGVKNAFLRFLLDAKHSAKKVAAYGAAAKGNTLLNYGGIKPDLLPYVCDANPSKRGKYLPGSRIPVVAPQVLLDQKPDFVVILPWNISSEVMNDISFIRDWGARFVIAVPRLREFY